MPKYNTQENALFRLYEDWRALIRLRGTMDPGTPARQELDKKYNQVLPVIARITDIEFRSQVDTLAIEALSILEKTE